MADGFERTTARTHQIPKPAADLIWQLTTDGKTPKPGQWLNGFTAADKDRLLDQGVLNEFEVQNISNVLQKGVTTQMLQAITGRAPVPAWHDLLLHSVKHDPKGVPEVSAGDVKRLARWNEVVGLMNPGHNAGGGPGEIVHFAKAINSFSVEPPRTMADVKRVLSSGTGVLSAIGGFFKEHWGDILTIASFIPGPQQIPLRFAVAGVAIHDAQSAARSGDWARMGYSLVGAVSNGSGLLRVFSKGSDWSQSKVSQLEQMLGDAGRLGDAAKLLDGIFVGPTDSVQSTFDAIIATLSARGG